ncbi:diguanylate cyclase domain-containing protein [Leptolyngbya sp. AN02str]|uniref:GGDEF domain-containing protein n=1 Tax=Leptolyngbya sp. AN02str TaxID=3423363 RepID=UPI003D31CA62
MDRLDSVDWLLEQAVGAIAQTYQAECALWSHIDQRAGRAQVHATPGFWDELAEGISTSNLSELSDAETSSDFETSARLFRLTQLPLWLTDQWRSPQMVQLASGSLIVPVVSPEITLKLETPGWQGSLQLVLELRRPLQPTPSMESSDAAVALFSTTIQGWTEAELQSLKARMAELGLAYGMVYWHDKLEQSRQHMAMMGRMAHLLNSRLVPDLVVQEMLAELGQEFGSDRVLLLHLTQHVDVVADWARTEPNDPEPLSSLAGWRDAADLFVQDGVSYLWIEPLSDTTEGLRKLLHQLQASSLLLVPLFLQAKFFGMVCLITTDAAHAYALETVQIVSQTMDYVAIALTQLQGYQTPLPWLDSNGVLAGTTMYESDRDPLTHCLAREALDRELKRRSSKALWIDQPPFSLLICDIDYFKLVNDSYGYPVGDSVLKTLAARLQHHLRKETPIYRYGGEQFVILLADTSLELAVEVAERLQQSIRGVSFAAPHGSIQITTSLGVAQQDPNRDTTAWDVLERAEAALLDAKRHGRNCVKAL